MIGEESAYMEHQKFIKWSSCAYSICTAHERLVHLISIRKPNWSGLVLWFELQIYSFILSPSNPCNQSWYPFLYQWQLIVIINFFKKWSTFRYDSGVQDICWSLSSQVPLDPFFCAFRILSGGNHVVRQNHFFRIHICWLVLVLF